MITMKRATVILISTIMCLGVLLAYTIHTKSPLPAEGAGNANEITKVEIAKHGTAADCWVAIGGNVYDLTNYFQQNSNLDPSKFCGDINPSAKLPTNMTTEALSTYNIGLLAP